MMSVYSALVLSILLWVLVLCEGILGYHDVCHSICSRTRADDATRLFVVTD